MKAAIEPMHAICEHLLDDIKRDSESFDLYMQALTLPKETEEEKAARQEAMQNGLKAAVAVPLSVAKRALEIVRGHLEALAKRQIGRASCRERV